MDNRKTNNESLWTKDYILLSYLWEIPLVHTYIFYTSAKNRGGDK